MFSEYKDYKEKTNHIEIFKSNINFASNCMRNWEVIISDCFSCIYIFRIPFQMNVFIAFVWVSSHNGFLIAGIGGFCFLFICWSNKCSSMLSHGINHSATLGNLAHFTTVHDLTLRADWALSLKLSQWDSTFTKFERDQSIVIDLLIS